MSFDGPPPPELDHPSDEDLAAFVTGAADPVMRALVHEHLWRCPECSRAAEELRATDAAVVEALGRARRRRRPAVRRASLALVLATVAVLIAFGWCRAIA